MSIQSHVPYKSCLRKKKKPKETYGGQTEEQRMGSKSTLEKWLVLGLGREDTDVLEELKTTAGSL